MKHTYHQNINVIKRNQYKNKIHTRSFSFLNQTQKNDKNFIERANFMCVTALLVTRNNKPRLAAFRPKFKILFRYKHTSSEERKKQQQQQHSIRKHRNRNRDKQIKRKKKSDTKHKVYIIILFRMFTRSFLLACKPSRCLFRLVVVFLFIDHIEMYSNRECVCSLANTCV